MKKTILFVFTVAILLLIVLTPNYSHAQSCSGGCYTACPNGTIPLSGTCPSGQVCCSGMITNPGSYNANNSMSQSTQQGTPTTTSQSSGFGNPLGTDTVEGVLGNIMSYLRGIAGTIAVIFIIIGGVMYMVSGGDKDAVERAKKTVIYAAVGLAIVLAAPLFYQEIKAVLSGNSPGSAFQALLINFLKLLLAIVGFLAIIMMVIGGIWILTAAGNEERYELGKKTATYSILGLVIAVAALIIAQQVSILIGGGSSIINNAANSPAAGASVPAIPDSSSTPVNNSTPNLPGTTGI